MRKIADIFNKSSVVFYAANETAQKIYQGAESCSGFPRLLHGNIQEMCRRAFEATAPQGYDLYAHLPAGQEIRFYASSFFGAAALNYMGNMMMPERLEKYRSEIAATFSMAALTYHEMNVVHSRFDWADMAAYAGAVGLSYGLNRAKYKEIETPDINQ